MLNRISFGFIFVILGKQDFHEILNSFKVMIYNFIYNPHNFNPDIKIIGLNISSK